MVAKIGKLTFLIFYVFSCCADQITMQIVDTDGEQLQQVAVNMPFVIEISVTMQDGSSITNTAPEIAGIKQLSIDEKTHASSINSIINGHRSYKKIYRFIAHAERIGRFSIGPATVTINNKLIRSNTITFSVVQQVVSKAQDSLLRLSINKSTLYLGESALCTLRFYPGKSTTLEGITQPQFNSFKAQQLEGPFAGNETVDGAARDYVEWRAQLSPQEIGNLTIPAVAAVYKAEKKKRPTAFDLFERMFDGGFEQKQIFSNILTVHVKPLPEFDKVVHGVGNFDAIKASIDHVVAQEGEGLVFKLSVDGQDGTVLKAPSLFMPSGLKYYDSKSYDQEIEKGKKRHCFEYIVQGVQAGAYQIGSQEFIFFDTTQQKYVTLHSNSVDVEIKPGAVRSGQTTNTAHQSHQEQSSVDQETTIHIVNAAEHYSYHIPWHLFFIACALPFIWFITRAAQVRHKVSENFYIRKKVAFNIAYKQLNGLAKNNEHTPLYVIISNLTKNLAIMTDEQSLQESLCSWLASKNVEEKVIEGCRAWLEELSAYRFGAHQFDYQDKKRIFAETRDWLKLLERLA